MQSHNIHEPFLLEDLKFQTAGDNSGTRGDGGGQHTLAALPWERYAVCTCYLLPWCRRWGGPQEQSGGTN
jgi:hypothetical protein